MLIAYSAEILETVGRLDLTSAIKSGFAAYAADKVVLPPVGELLLPRGETHIKAGFIEGDETYVVKIATGFYDNPAKGLRSSNGLLLLIDANTGVPVAILLDEGHLTDIRTAVAGAIAAEYLAPSPVIAIGVIGTGIQARLQVEYLAKVTPCRRVTVLARRRDAAMQYRDDMAKKGYDVEIAASSAELVERANLIVTTTPASKPVLSAAEVRPGTHVTAVGADSPAKNEIDPELFSKASVVVADSLVQCRERGEIRHALAAGALRESQIVELAELVTGQKPGRSHENQITIADLTGVAVQDIKIAQAVYAALAQKKKHT